MSTPDHTYTASKSSAKPLGKRDDKSHDVSVALRRYHLVLWFAAAFVGIAIAVIACSLVCRGLHGGHRHLGNH